MPRLIYSRRALEDIARLREFLLPKDPVAAANAANAIRKTIALLKVQPLIGKPKDEGYREIESKFGKTGYMILYRLHNQTIVITAIKHQKEADYMR